MIILIPAYEPDGQLLRPDPRPRAADRTGSRIVVVDDGSGPAYAARLRRRRPLGADVIGYRGNRGKGHALKTGFGYIARPTAPAQRRGLRRQRRPAPRGGHPAGGRRAACRRRPTTMVLGGRHFTGEVPAAQPGRQRRPPGWLFRAGHRRAASRTPRPGCAATRPRMLAWLQTVRGDRYEYELNILLEARRPGYRPRSGARSRPSTWTTMRPRISGRCADSLRIYAPLLKFLLSSLTAFLPSTRWRSWSSWRPPALSLLAVLGARAVSSAVNFAVNRQPGVSGGPGPHPPSAPPPATSPWCLFCSPPTIGAALGADAPACRPCPPRSWPK